MSKLLASLREEELKDVQKGQQLLYQIISQTHQNLGKQLKQALKLTTQLFDLELGIISSVKGDEYRIAYYYANNCEIEAEGSTSLDQTYCSKVIQKGDLLALNISDEEWAEGSFCFPNFKMDTYLGVPLYLDNELYGTLSFAGQKENNSGFSAADKNLVKLLAQWISSVLKRQQVEAKLREREQRYEVISTNSADMVCLHASDGTYKFISPSVKKILGYTPQELLGKNPYNLFHPDDQERIRNESHQKALKKEPASNFQYRIRKKDGSYIWFETSTESITDENGNVIKLQTTSRDISSRKNLEILFSEAQKMAHVGGWEFDLQSGALTWTDEVYRIHELPVGKPLKIEDGLSFYPKDVKEVVETSIQGAIEHDLDWDIEVPFVTAKGHNKWVRAKGRAEFLEGKAYKLLGTFQDVTLQKEFEKKIHEQNVQLQNLTETKDKIYSILAHDLKGVFFGISGMLGLIKEDLEDYTEIDPTLFSQLSLVESSTNQAQQLFENLLHWTRLQSNALRPDFSEVDLSKEIHKAVKLFHSSIENKNLILSLDFDEELTLIGDANMLSTIIRNLISNAIKFTLKNGTVSVEAEKSNNTIQLKVSDTGIGMPKGVEKNLFNPDKRPGRSGTKNENGNGLGLLLTKEMVQIHKGTISVESEEDKGSRFTITLPVNPE